MKEVVAGLHRGHSPAARAHSHLTARPAWDFLGGQRERQEAALTGQLGNVNTDGTLFFEGLWDDFGEFHRPHCGYIEKGTSCKTFKDTYSNSFR